MLIYGKNPVFEALNAGREVYEVFTSLEKDKVLDLAKNRGVKVTRLDKKTMDQRFTNHHQGIGANVKDYETVALKPLLDSEDGKLFLMLDSITDPHNLGAIIRSAEAFGVTGIIFPKDRSASINATVVKVSAGAIEHIRLIEVTNLHRTMLEMKKHNIWVVGLDLGTDNGLDDIYADTDLCLVLGSEGKGMRPLVKKTCDTLAKIPMIGSVNSLNVSVSAGVALYDIVSRRNRI
ncbi:MAG: 23S rRNA (guanosine(2251)-2'-O)-methyltransferase RlmB [Bacillota bacterium]